MDLIDVRNYDTFAEYLSEHVIEIEDGDMELVVGWFIAMREAQGIMESFSTKDLGHLLYDGYPSVKENLDTAVESYFETIFDEYDDVVEGGDEDPKPYREEAIEVLTDHLTQHFGEGYNW